MADSSAWQAWLDAAEQNDRVASVVSRAEVEAAWSSCTLAWPQLTIDPEVFGRNLARVVTDDTVLGDLALADFALAAQCLAGDTKALSQLDVEINRQAHRIALRSRLDAPEIAQLLRVHLLTAAPGSAPRLEQYAAKSKLSSWLKVVGGRLALNEERADSRHPSGGAEFCEPISNSTPELNALHAERQARFAEAFRAAYRARSTAEREVLRHYFVDRQTLAAVADTLGVHTSTAARRLTAARTALLEDFHRQLDRLVHNDGLAAEQLLSILRSRLQLSDTSLMRTREP